MAFHRLTRYIKFSQGLQGQYLGEIQYTKHKKMLSLLWQIYLRHCV